jgi:hypothetical protein
MSKVAKAEDTALTVAPQSAMSLIPSAEQMGDGFVAPQDSKFLPFLEMVFPVMQTPDKPQYKGKEWTIGFQDGNSFRALPAGAILTVLDKRNVIKREYKDEAGQPKNEYAAAELQRGTPPQTYNRTTARYNELLMQEAASSNIFKGFSLITIVLLPDGRTVVCDCATFKTFAGYIYPALGSVALQSKTGLKINIESHEANCTKAKTSGHFYPDKKKFTQWEHVQLTPEQLTKAVEAVNLAGEAYLTWLNK